MNFFHTFMRPIIFQFAPEFGHSMAIAALKTGLGIGQQISDKRLAVKVAGLEFPNFLGLAAGFDKNAEIPDAILRLGFGFTEVGTITPKPQAGNPKPRLFRLVEDEAVINRMGFNNQGHDSAYHRLNARKRQGIVGVNIGANKDSADRINDYSLGIKQFYDVADYFVVNISSPNTPGLRNLQAKDSLKELLSAISEARAAEKAKANSLVPVFLKIAPDLSETGLDDIADQILASDLDGVIVSNTTLSRTGLQNTSFVNEAGGLSGKPLFERSTIVLAKMRERLGKNMPIIGVGGVRDCETAIEKIKAGADLVQLYSALVYEGTTLASDILKATVKTMQKDGINSILDYRDQTTKEWAKRDIPA